MSFSKKTLFVGVIIVFLIGIVYFHHKNSNSNQSSVKSSGGDHRVNIDEKNEQQKAEEYAENMKPKIKEKLKKDDIHHFVNGIHLITMSQSVQWE
ncbi:hypothetical protein [Bacillus vallismortis]|uniref:hypothetical protein n=1 Tax=Bacillus vallismortis TaxID=72361 RepID=UPI001F50CB33|nr:hypothetical protein [Bacillus vallismortis]MEC1268177.1 hypothetical protein [Bacillus vallismortis]